MKNILQVKDVCFSYHTKAGETMALQDLSFNVKEGEFVSIVGPSGCGKTTILSMISGLMFPSSGEIILDGIPVKKINTDIGYMFQKDNLFEWLTVLDNVLLGVRIQGKKNKEYEVFANHLLDKYGLADFKKYYPKQLSGGMRQRVSLIRTLAIMPKILLLDEPFSALDYQTRIDVQNNVHDIIKSEKKTVVLVTHDIAEATIMSDRVLVFSERPASVKRVFNIDIDSSLSPLEKRDTPLFNSYFNQIWKELKNNEK